MKYNNIKLLGKNNLYFIKYDDDKKVEMDKISSLDTSLSKSVISPDISSYGYMLFHGMYHAIGMIKITMGDDLNISLSLDRNNLTEESISVFTNDIVESLCRLCPFYKYIVINGIKVENKFNSLNELLVNEIYTFKTSLLNSKKEFKEKYDNNSYVENEYDRKDNSKKVVRRDLFIETDKVSIYDIVSNHNNSNITFNYDGTVSFETLGRPKGRYYSLQVDYNVSKSNMRLYCVRNNNRNNTEIIEIKENDRVLEYSKGMAKIEYNKETGYSKYKYNKIYDEYSGVDFELYTDKDKNIVHCYLDLNIMKQKTKLKGKYMIRIKDNKMLVYYNHRKGSKDEILSLSYNKKIGIDELVILVHRALLQINKIDNIDTSFINFDELFNLKNEINEFLRKINGRLPLPIFNEIIESYNSTLEKQKVLRTS